jgi:NAD(P)H-hydrate epimerase
MTTAIDDGMFEGKTAIAIGPGLGARAAELTLRAALAALPMVVDADALAAGGGWPVGAILTPHPGEMARLAGKSTAEIQADRIGAARGFATEHGVTLVLKGQRTVVAFADGRVWINPTGTPAMGTGGSGDVLTGMVAGLLAQFPKQPDEAVAGAVYLHGLAGERAAGELGEKPAIATDILRFLPEALREAAGAR